MPQLEKKTKLCMDMSKSFFFFCFVFFLSSGLKKVSSTVKEIQESEEFLEHLITEAIAVVH